MTLNFGEWKNETMPYGCFYGYVGSITSTKNIGKPKRNRNKVKASRKASRNSR